MAVLRDRPYVQFNFLVNLDGRGEVGAVVDSGFDLGDLAGADPPGPRGMTPFHPDLATNMRLLRSRVNPLNTAFKPRDNTPHGTHVAGTVAGDGTSSGGQVRGMAPGTSLVGLGAPFAPGVVMMKRLSIIGGERERFFRSELHVE